MMHYRKLGTVNSCQSLVPKQEMFTINKKKKSWLVCTSVTNVKQFAQILCCLQAYVKLCSSLGLVAQIMFGFGPRSGDICQNLCRFFRPILSLSLSFFFFAKKERVTTAVQTPFILHNLSKDNLHSHINSKRNVLLMTRLLVTSYCYGVVSYKACHALRLFLTYRTSPSEL
jgi:hypothetical protein